MMRYISDRAAARLKDFRDDKSGVIAVIFALVLVPILLVVGLAIDYGQASSYQSRMQKELDQAVIAGASEFAKSRNANKAKTVTVRRFNATKERGRDVELRVQVDGRKGTITASAETDVKMNFMGLAGFTVLTVNADAMASAGSQRSAKRIAAANAIRKVSRNAPKMSESDVRDLIYKVNRVCYKLRQLGMAGRVRQCGAVFDGSFEQKLKAKLANGGNASSLLPSGVRLVK